MKKKSKLDERQEQVLLKIEHYGFWLFFWLTFLNSLVMPFVSKDWAIGLTSGSFLLVCVVTIIACAWNGIFDRHFSLSMKTNVLTALCAGLFGLIVMTVQNHSMYKVDWSHAFLAGLFTGVSIGIITFVLMLIVSSATKRRLKKLNKEPQDKD